jgi:antitoxin HigA-1
MRMHNPPHPRGILRDAVLPELEMTVKEAARQIGVDRVMLSRVISGKASISPEMALRLEAWFDRHGYTGDRAEQWLGMQSKHDLWQARKKMAAA